MDVFDKEEQVVDPFGPPGGGAGEDVSGELFQGWDSSRGGRAPQGLCVGAGPAHVQVSRRAPPKRRERFAAGASAKLGYSLGLHLPLPFAPPPSLLVALARKAPVPQRKWRREGKEQALGLWGEGRLLALPPPLRKLPRLLDKREGVANRKMVELAQYDFGVWILFQKQSCALSANDLRPFHYLWVTGQVMKTCLSF